MVGGEPAPTASARSPPSLLPGDVELSRVEVVTSHDLSSH